MTYIIRNEKDKAVGIVLSESRGVAAVYDIPSDTTYIDIEGSDGLTRKQAKAVMRSLRKALEASR